MQWWLRSLAFASAALLALGASCAARAQEPSPDLGRRWPQPARLVAFADVHGAYDALVALLQKATVIDAELRWSGGTTHVVSLGDLIDRGADTRRVLDLVMRLERESGAAGGGLHVVLGNHEVMNLIGDWRYVAAGDYASFAVDEPSELRASQHARLVEALGSAAPTRAEFDRTYPPGFFARQAAFAPQGRYGAWLLGLPALVVVGDTAFVHGGLPPIVAEQGLALNESLRTKLVRYLELRDKLAARGVLVSPARDGDLATAHAALAAADRELKVELEELLALGTARELGVEGPLWYRGSLYCKPLLETPTLVAALAKLGAGRVVVGHTPAADRRVHALYGGTLVAADTGMLVEYFRGRPATLELGSDDALEVQYLDPASAAALEADTSTVAHGRSDGQWREALARGTVARVERRGGAAPWRVELEHGGVAFEAAFYPREDDAGGRELAAAALDDLLGTALVAPTVPRTIEGQAGALQLRFEGALTEAERAERELGFSGWCPIEPQIGLMYTFDALLQNRGRGAANVLFVNDLTDLVLTDHGQAFGVDRALSRLEASRLVIPDALRATLRALDERQLTATLGEWLDERRIDALLARRDVLLGVR
jgi:hypothetical protein